MRFDCGEMRKLTLAIAFSASAWNQSACGPGITRSSARPFDGSVKPADFR